jgi:hypothetical protein
MLTPDFTATILSTLPTQTIRQFVVDITPGISFIYDLIKAKRSLLMVAASVVGIP